MILLYVAKYLMCISTEDLIIIVTKKSNMSYYWTCDTLIIRRVSLLLIFVLKKVLSPFCGSLLQHLVERIDPRLVIVIGQSSCSFEKSSCILLTPLLWMSKVVLFSTWCRMWFIIFHIDLLDCTIAFTCLQLIIKNGCHQKEGVTLRHQYLKASGL